MTAIFASPDQDLVWRQKLGATPLESLGSNLAVWLQADKGVATAFDDPAPTWVNQVANGNAVQDGNADAPVLRRNAFGSKPGMSFETLDAGLVLDLTTPIAIGKRPYMWVHAKLNTINVVAGQPLALIGTSPSFLSNNGMNAFAAGIAAPEARWEYLAIFDPDFAESFQAATELDLYPHTLQGATQQEGFFVFDGRSYDASAPVPAIGEAISTLYLSNYGPAGAGPGTGGQWSIGVVVVAYDTPTPAQIANVAEYCSEYANLV
jgi:hypothetical protein